VVYISFGKSKVIWFHEISFKELSFLTIFILVQNWSKSSLLDKMTELAARRKLDDLTIGPVLTVRIPNAKY